MKRLSNYKLYDTQTQEDFSADSSSIEEQLNNGELRDSLIQEGRYNQLPSNRRVHASFTSQKNSMYLNQVQNQSDQQFLPFQQQQGNFFQFGSSSSGITARTLNIHQSNGIKALNQIDNIRLVDKLFDDKTLGIILQYLNISDILSFFSIYLDMEKDLLAKKQTRNWEIQYKSVFQIKFSPSKRLFAEQITTRLITQSLSQNEYQKFFEIIIRYDKLLKYFPDDYEKKYNIVTNYEQDILKDVDRTFHDTKHLNNQRNLNQLIEILTALSHSVPDVGYIQGWNMIAGVFIKNQFNPQLTYWIINYIMHKMQAKQLFLNNFKATHILDYQFEVLCKNYIPDLYDFLVIIQKMNIQYILLLSLEFIVLYLLKFDINQFYSFFNYDYQKKFDFEINYFSNSWFLTLFSFDLPYSCVLRVWMLFVLKGWKYLLKIGIAILIIVKGNLQRDLFKNQIMNSVDEDEINQFLKKYVCKHFINNQNDEQKLFDIAQNIKVSNTLMDRLDQLYQNHHPKLKMNLKIKRIKIGSNKLKTIIEMEREQNYQNNNNSAENCNLDEDAGSDTNKLNNNQIFNRRATYELNYYIGGQKRQFQQNIQLSQISLGKTQQIGQFQQQNQQQSPLTSQIIQNQNNEVNIYENNALQNQRQNFEQGSLNNHNNMNKTLKITKIIGQSHIPHQRTNNSVILNGPNNSVMLNGVNNNQDQNNNNTIYHQSTFPPNKIHTGNNNNQYTNQLTNDGQEQKYQKLWKEEMKTSLTKEGEYQIPSLQTQTTMSSQNHLTQFQNSSITSSFVENNSRKNDLNFCSRFSNILQQQNSQRDDLVLSSNPSQLVIQNSRLQSNNIQLSSISEQVTTQSYTERQLIQNQNNLAQSYLPLQDEQTLEKSLKQNQQQHSQNQNIQNNNQIKLQTSIDSQQEMQINEPLSTLNQINKSKVQSKDVSPTAAFTKTEEQYNGGIQVINLMSVKKNSEIMAFNSQTSLQTLPASFQKSEINSQISLQQFREEKSPLTINQKPQLLQLQKQQIQQSQKGQTTTKQTVENNSFFQKIINIFKTKENQSSNNKDQQNNKDSKSIQDQNQKKDENQNEQLTSQNFSFNKQQRNKSFDIIGAISNTQIQQTNQALPIGSINRKQNSNPKVYMHLHTQGQIQNHDLSHESLNYDVHNEEEGIINNSNRFTLSRKYSVQNNGRTTPSNRMTVHRCNRESIDNQSQASLNTNNKNNNNYKITANKKEVCNENNSDQVQQNRLNDNYSNNKTENDNGGIFPQQFDQRNQLNQNQKGLKSDSNSQQYDITSQQVIVNKIKQQQQNLLQNQQIIQNKYNGSGDTGRFANNQSNIYIQKKQQDQNQGQQCQSIQKIQSQPQILKSINSQTIISSKKITLTSQVNSKTGEQEQVNYSGDKNFYNNQIQCIQNCGLSPPKQLKKDEDILSQDDQSSLSHKLKNKSKNFTKIPLKSVNQISPSEYKLQMQNNSKNNTTITKNSIPQEFNSDHKSPNNNHDNQISHLVQPFETNSQCSNNSQGKKTNNEVSEFSNQTPLNNSIRIFNCKSNTNLTCNEGFSPTKEHGPTTSNNNNNFYYLGNPQYFQNNHRTHSDKNEIQLNATSDLAYKIKKENQTFVPQQVYTSQNKNNYYISTASSNHLNNLSSRNMGSIATPSTNSTSYANISQKNYENNVNNLQNGEFISSINNNNQYKGNYNPENYQSNINQESHAEKTNSLSASNSKYMYKKHSVVNVNVVDIYNKKSQ